VSERFLTSHPERTLAAVMDRARWNEPTVVRQVALSLGTATASVADPALREITLRNGNETYVADAVTSSIAGREAAFVSSLIASSPPAGSLDNASAVLAVAAAAVMQSGDVEQTDTLLARLTESNAPAWIKTALLDGVDRLIPRTDDGERRMTLSAPNRSR
jgi:hypothetical protein